MNVKLRFVGTMNLNLKYSLFCMAVLQLLRMAEYSELYTAAGWNYSCTFLFYEQKSLRY